MTGADFMIQGLSLSTCQGYNTIRDTKVTCIAFYLFYVMYLLDVLVARYTYYIMSPIQLINYFSCLYNTFTVPFTFHSCCHDKGRHQGVNAVLDVSQTPDLI